jgi:hypothetical protein
MVTTASAEITKEVYRYIVKLADIFISRTKVYEIYYFFFIPWIMLDDVL